jgi:hypothetical protein
MTAAVAPPSLNAMHAAPRGIFVDRYLVLRRMFFKELAVNSDIRKIV